MCNIFFSRCVNFSKIHVVTLRRSPARCMRIRCFSDILHVFTYQSVVKHPNSFYFIPSFGNSSLDFFFFLFVLEHDTNQRESGLLCGSHKSLMTCRIETQLNWLAVLCSLTEVKTVTKEKFCLIFISILGQPV